MQLVKEKKQFWLPVLWDFGTCSRPTPMRSSKGICYPQCWPYIPLHTLTSYLWYQALLDKTMMPPSIITSYPEHISGPQRCLGQVICKGCPQWPTAESSFKLHRIFFNFITNMGSQHRFSWTCPVNDFARRKGKRQTMWSTNLTPDTSFHQRIIL